MSVEKPPCILAVDDHQDNLDLLSEILQLDHYELLTAGDADTALELARAHKPDLAILDVEMPAVDGYELCRRLRAELSHWELPIIFLTARCTDPADAARGLDLGACDYVTKPFDARELRARVRAALRGRAAHAQDVALAKTVARRLRG